MGEELSLFTAKLKLMAISGAALAIIYLASPGRVAAQVFQWPVLQPCFRYGLTCNGNDYSAYNATSPPNYRYHAGVDLRSSLLEPGDYTTPVIAAASGTVRLVVGLAPKGGGPEEIATWEDSNTNGMVDAGEVSAVFATERTNNNHGFGIAIVIDHGGSFYSLYGHLYAVKKQLYDSVVGGGTYSVNKGDPIAVLGSSGYSNYKGHVYPHLHFEIKNQLDLGQKAQGGACGPTDPGWPGYPDRCYWGYTPGFPGGYGYRDPRTLIFPFSGVSISPTAIRVNPSNGLWVRTGPDPGKYPVTLMTLNPYQDFVAFEVDKTGSWYHIYIPNAGGPFSGWIAGTYQGTVYSIPDSGAVQIEISNTGADGYAKIYPSEVASTEFDLFDSFSPSGCRYVKVWEGQRFVGQFHQNGRYQFFIPPLFYPSNNPYVAQGATCTEPFPYAGGYSFGWIPEAYVVSYPSSAETLSVFVNAYLHGTFEPGGWGTPPWAVDLYAFVGGTAVGTINYTFWWNCSNGGTSVANVSAACGNPNDPNIGAKFDAVEDNPKVVSHSYSSEGVYALKVIAERGGASPAESRTSIVVSTIVTGRKRRGQTISE